MKRRVYHVIPAGLLWAIKRKGARRPAAWCVLKKNAMEFAKTFVRKNQQPGQVVVHGADGRIETEWTYGGDPRRTPG
jgi:hypothetical protein